MSERQRTFYTRTKFEFGLDTSINILGQIRFKQILDKHFRHGLNIEESDSSIDFLTFAEKFA